MHETLRADEIECMAEIVWLLCENRGKAEARPAVLGLVSQLLRADYTSSFIWDDNSQRSNRRHSINMSEQLLIEYDQHHHKYDLVTPTMHRVGHAANVDSAIERSTLLNSQFYFDFLKPAGMYHGINVYFKDNNRDVGDLRIWRGAGDPPFADREERILRELTPYFVKSLATQKTDVKLSQRELDVARLVANGASDKQVAQVLGISFTTVRTHLNNAMNKFQCTNRTQLARHF